VANDALIQILLPWGSSVLRRVPTLTYPAFLRAADLEACHVSPAGITP